MARNAATAAAKEHILMAVMAGRGGPDDRASVTVGERIEARARESLKAALAA